MEDEIGKKKKKFSFLASLGFGSKTENPSEDKNKKNAFYVGNFQSDLKKRKTVLESIE